MSLLIDYYHLNQRTVLLNFLLPRINDYLAQLSGSVVFSELDFNSGFYQIPVTNPIDI